MKKILFLLLFAYYICFINAQDNDFFIKLAKKDIATFNDGITLIRLLFNERDYESTYIENVIWAVEKKLFKVTLPIKDDQFNPLLTRSTFAEWICRIYSGKNGLVNNSYIWKLTAFKVCVKLDIIPEARGAFDSFTGSELLDTFSYLDYYIRSNNIKPNKEIMKLYEDDYDNLPEWRSRLYREIEEQHRLEKEFMEKSKKERIEKRELLKKEKKQPEEVKIEE